MGYKEVGMDTINRFARMISAQFDGDPIASGRNITVVLVKSAEQKTAAQ